MKHTLTPIHDGELSMCSVCMAAEGTLPSECSGVPMTHYQEEAVFVSELDFKNGVWFKPHLLQPIQPKND